MSELIKDAPIILYESSLSSKQRKNKNFDKKKFKYSNDNKENISINIVNTIKREDNSSSKELKIIEEENENEIEKERSISKDIKQKKKINFLDNQKILYQKKYDKYAQKIKEKEMRNELQRIYHETERLKQKYQEKNSNLHIFNNNPQFKKMINKLERQLLYFLFVDIILHLFNEIIYFKLTNEKEEIGLASFCLSITLVTISLLLLIFLKLGLLNDPHLSKTFRFFEVLEFLILTSTFFFNIVTGFLSIYYIQKIAVMKVNIVIYLLFLAILFIFILRIKYNINLFIESLFILLGKKTEYSILILRERKLNKENNSDNLSASLSIDRLNKTNSNLFDDINQNYGEFNKDEEEKFLNYNYYNKFHYSVSSDREGEKYKLKKLGKFY